MAIIQGKTTSKITRAGRPDIMTLLELGVIKIGSDGKIVGNLENPVETIKQRVQTVDGQWVDAEKKVNRGHVKNPDAPAWRVGLDPELYWEKLMKETELKQYGTPERVAPVLESSEAESFVEWLIENLDDLTSGLDKEDIPNTALIRTAKKKAAGRAAGTEEAPQDVQLPDPADQQPANVTPSQDGVEAGGEPESTDDKLTPEQLAQAAANVQEGGATDANDDSVDTTQTA